MRRKNKSEMIRRLIDFVKAEGSVSVEVAAEMLGVSEVTARRYLNEIASMDLPVKRVRGGLVFVETKGSIEAMFEAKLSLNVDEKKRIAEEALKFVEDGDSVALDSGTTIFFLARILGKRKGLKVLAVDVKVAEELAKKPDIEVLIACGRVRNGYFSVGGEMTVEFLERFEVEKTFLSADAIDPEAGVTNSSLFEAKVKETLARIGKRVVLLADHTKIGKRAFVKAVPLDLIDVIITTKGADDEVVEELKEKGIEVRIV